MTNLYHSITVVGIIQIGSYAAPLSLPIKPRAEGAVMDIVFTDDGVDGAVKFNSGHFVSPKFVFYSNIINMIMLDPTNKNTAQVPNNTILSAIMYLVVTHNM